MKLFNLFEEQTAERKETRKFAFILQDALIELGATDTKIKFGSDKNIVEGTITLIYEINSYKLSLQYYCSYLLLEDNFLLDRKSVV